MKKADSARRRVRVQEGWASSVSMATPSDSSQVPEQGLGATGHRFTYEQQEPKQIKKGVCPYNFDWIEDGVLLAMAIPTRKEHLEYLEDCNVKYVVSCMENRPKCLQLKHNFVSIFLKAQSFGVPTVEQVQKFLETVQTARRESKVVAVHCRYGNGRTGVLIACYFIHQYSMSADEAIHKLRETRPESIENKRQEQFVYNFEKLHQD